MASSRQVSQLDLSEDSSVSILPGVGILGVFSHINYSAWYALAEYVDNAIQSAEMCSTQLNSVEHGYRLKVDIQYERDNGGRIIIHDNAGGIARSEFDRAFKAAELPPDRMGLSEFGMGMKSASIWFARNWRVTTKSVEDPYIYTVDFDMDRLLADKQERLHVHKKEGKRFDHFTRIELWNLNQQLSGRTLGKVREHLREMYRVFMREGRLSLTVVGEKLAYEVPATLVAPDYRQSDQSGDVSSPVTWRKDIQFEVNGGIKASGWAAIRAEGKTNGAGISLIRRNRVIIGTEEAPYRPASVFGSPNSYRFQRIFGELEIEGLAVSHTKDGFQWNGKEDEFESELKRCLDEPPLELLKQAEGYRARVPTKVEQKRIAEAGENTVDATKRALPTALPRIEVEASTPNPPIDVETEAGRTFDFKREITFSQSGRIWSISFSSAPREDEPRWLTYQVETSPTARTVRATISLNTAHPFISNFALGSKDSIEAIFRVAVALVVAECLQTTAGDGESAKHFMRQVSLLLSEVLSKR